MPADGSFPLHAEIFKKKETSLQSPSWGGNVEAPFSAPSSISAPAARGALPAVSPGLDSFLPTTSPHLRFHHVSEMLMLALHEQGRPFLSPARFAFLSGTCLCVTLALKFFFLSLN